MGYDVFRSSNEDGKNKIPGEIHENENETTNDTDMTEEKSTNNEEKRNEK